MNDSWKNYFHVYLKHFRFIKSTLICWEAHTYKKKSLNSFRFKKFRLNQLTSWKKSEEQRASEKNTLRKRGEKLFLRAVGTLSVFFPSFLPSFDSLECVVRELDITACGNTECCVFIYLNCYPMWIVKLLLLLLIACSYRSFVIYKDTHKSTML